MPVTHEDHPQRAVHAAIAARAIISAIHICAAVFEGCGAFVIEPLSRPGSLYFGLLLLLGMLR
jgi:hypothetical protein